MTYSTPGGGQYQCPHCGAATPPNASFCPSCGGRLSMAAPLAAAPVQLPPPSPAPAAKSGNPAAGILGLVVLGAIAYVWFTGNDDTAPAGGSGSSRTTAPVLSNPTLRPAPTTAAGFAPIQLSGRGDKVAKFTIPEDTAAIATIRYSGSGNFAVWTLGASGSENDLLVNEIGRYSGTVLFEEGFGVHSVAFEITATGAWNITVKPVTSARKWGGSERLTGDGDDVVLVSPATSGFTTATIKHSGKSNFAVWAYAPDGTDLLINDIGRYNGEVVLPDGTLLLEVTADGSWSVAIN